VPKSEKYVEAEVIKYLRHNGFSVHVYESKASFSKSSNSYRKNRSLVEGHSDIAGCDKDGLAVYIELKTPKTDNSMRMSQYMFLREKIKFGAFVCVISGIDKLEALYSEFKKTRSKDLLINALPENVELPGRSGKILRSSICI